jgi:hypothetical protein
MGIAMGIAWFKDVQTIIPQKTGRFSEQDCQSLHKKKSREC